MKSSLETANRVGPTRERPIPARSVGLFGLLLALLLFSAPHKLTAQGVPPSAAISDTVRGRIVDSADVGVQRAVVAVVSMRTRRSRLAAVDRSGSYAVVFPSGGGEYYVTVSAPFLPNVRVHVQGAGGKVIVPDVILHRPAAAKLAEVQIQRQRPRSDTPGQRNIGDNGTTLIGEDLSRAPFDATSAGEIAAMAPEVIPTGNGGAASFVVPGNTPDQNDITLDGAPVH